MNLTEFMDRIRLTSSSTRVSYMITKLGDSFGPQGLGDQGERCFRLARLEAHNFASPPQPLFALKPRARGLLGRFRVCSSNCHRCVQQSEVSLKPTDEIAGKVQAMAEGSSEIRATLWGSLR